MSGECQDCGEHTLECSCERQSFQNSPGKERPQFLEDGKLIYLELKKKYPKQTNEDLNSILNALCTSIIYLTHLHVDPSNRRAFLQLIWNTLNKNIENLCEIPLGKDSDDVHKTV